MKKSGVVQVGVGGFGLRWLQALHGMREFLRAIAERRGPDTSGADNLMSLAMVMKGLEPSDKGRRVAIRV